MYSLRHPYCVAKFSGGSASLTGGLEMILQSIIASRSYGSPDGDQFQRLFVQWHDCSFLRLYLTLFHQILPFYQYIAAVMAPRSKDMADRTGGAAARAFDVMLPQSFRHFME
jgi:hypothetical protein